MPRLALAMSLTIGLAAAACNAPAASGPPSVAESSSPPALEASQAPAGGTDTACLDTAVAAILGRLTAGGADVPRLLDQHRDALISGLEAYAPPDAATTTWRDRFVAALRAGDLSSAGASVRMLASNEVAVATC